MAEAIDYKDAVVVHNDDANYMIQGQISSQSGQFNLIQTEVLATRIAIREVRHRAFPYARVRLLVNRQGFRLLPGSCFRFSYAPYNISNMILRVLTIEEKDVSDESIVVTCVEDPYYTTVEVDESTLIPSGGWGQAEFDYSYQVLPLQHFRVIETPAAFIGPLSTTYITPIASRRIGSELGYVLNYSTDGGVTYRELASVSDYAIHGLLVAGYPQVTQSIDTAIRFQIDFSLTSELSDIQSITMEELLSMSYNLCVMNNEIFAVQEIIPIQNNRYEFSGIYRGLYDTFPQAHAEGSDFYFLGNTITTFTHPSFIVGVTVSFKAVPYTGSDSGNIADALVVTL